MPAAPSLLRQPYCARSTTAPFRPRNSNQPIRISVPQTLNRRKGFAQNESFSRFAQDESAGPRRTPLPRRGRTLLSPRRDCTIELHHVTDHFRDRLIVLRRDLLINLYGCMERTGERRVFHNRNIVLGRHLANLAG